MKFLPGNIQARTLELGQRARRTRDIPTGTGTALSVHSAILLVVMITMTITLQTGVVPIIVASSVWVSMLLLLIIGLDYHPHDQFGVANGVTTFRAAGTAFLTGLIPVMHDNTLTQVLDQTSVNWVISIMVLVLLALDGIDGYLARRAQLSSAFGARFDMEIDAFLALVLALLIWRSGKTGFWILGLGILRYLFVAASVWSEPLRGELFPSQRRKVVCVIQIAALCLMLSPLLAEPLLTLVGVVAIACLLGSFAIDVRWLYRHAPVSNTQSSAVFSHPPSRAECQPHNARQRPDH